ncbi:MAG: hypothetical protein V1695_03255 [Candidatus Uhrbacteria bacterium]
MIAEVYVLKRLPRRLAFFDYQIPDGLQVVRGSLVRITFRNQALRAIVARVKDVSEHEKLQPINQVLDLNFLSDQELSIYENLACELIQSTATVLDAVFRPERKKASPAKQASLELISNKVRQSEINHITNSVQRIMASDRCFVETSDLVQASAIIATYLRAAKPKQQQLILAPHLHDVRMLTATIAKHQNNLATLDSQATGPQRADIAKDWRQGTTKTLIATRLGALIPAKKLDTIFLVRSGSDEHASYDRNPRYDARYLAQQWHQAKKAKLVFFNVVPRVEDKIDFEDTQEIDLALFPKTIVVDLKEEIKKDGYTILSESLLEQINQALSDKKQVLCSYNYKGQNLQQKGVGNKKVEAMLKELYPNKKIVRVEKNHTLTEGAIEQADIILATQFYFENIYNPFLKRNVGLVVELMADLGLSEPFYNATENTLIKLLELRGIAWRAQCPLVVQTWSIGLIKQMLDTPHGILQAESDIRRIMNYPPYGRIWRISYRGSDPGLTALEGQIKQAAPLAEIIDHDNQLEIRSSKEQIANISQLLQNIDDSFIIEVNPIRK